MTFSREWHAVGREAELAASQVAVGVTALGRADHSRLGDYTMAFFGLTIGLERIGKLIVVCDFAMDHQGAFPDNDFLKNTISHDLQLLLNHCEAVSQRRRPSGRYAKRPDDAIHHGIVLTLSEFGKLSRYYNLDFLAGGKATSLPEPVGAWWTRVGEPILARHYTSRQAEKDAAMADRLSEALEASTMVLHHSETGAEINDMRALAHHGAATRVVQKYGRVYTLQIVRWLACAISEISGEAAGKLGVEPFFGVDEPFAVFRNDDGYFRERRAWSIYG